MHGVERTITKHRPVVIYELDYRFGPQVNLTIPWMAAHGYDCAVPTPGKGPGTHCSVCNVLCMPEASMWNTVRPPRSTEVRRGNKDKVKERPAKRAGKRGGSLRRLLEEESRNSSRKSSPPSSAQPTPNHASEPGQALSRMTGLLAWLRG